MHYCYNDNGEAACDAQRCPFPNPDRKPEPWRGICSYCGVRRSERGCCCEQAVAAAHTAPPGPGAALLRELLAALRATVQAGPIVGHGDMSNAVNAWLRGEPPADAHSVPLYRALAGAEAALEGNDGG